MRIATNPVLAQKLLLILPLMLVILSACTSNYNGVSATKMAGQVEQVAVHRSFHVVAQDMPAFLGPVIVSNFSVAMAERGYQPVGADGDMQAIIAYEQDNLPVESGDVRFVARVVVTLADAKTGDAILSGSIQRLHTIQAGEFMHVGNASISFLDGFREMIQELPAPATDTSE